jgi:hypothetical protein
MAYHGRLFEMKLHATPAESSALDEAQTLERLLQNDPQVSVRAV